jgi:hypothetical protein
MRREYIKYKNDSIRNFKPKLDVKLIEVVNKASDSIIDRVCNIVSGSSIENIFVDNSNT